jgi:DNA-binding response OmpR family regulator
MKILIVDDDPAIRTLLLSVLGEKHEVSLLCDGHNAIAVLSDPNHGYDFVVIDYKMPRLSGEQVLEFLSAWQNIKTKFILISGYVLGKEKFNFPNLIASLTKPFSVKELVSLIEEESEPPAAIEN